MYIYRQSLGKESGRITGAARGRDGLKESSAS